MGTAKRSEENYSIYRSVAGIVHSVVGKLMKTLKKIGLCTVGGFNFIVLWHLNGIPMEHDSYWQKNKFLLFAKCQKMFCFLSICI